MNISNEIGAMQKFESFLLWNGTTLCSLHFVLQGYVINHCRLFCVFRFTSKSSPAVPESCIDEKRSSDVSEIPDYHLFLNVLVG